MIPFRLAAGFVFGLLVAHVAVPKPPQTEAPAGPAWKLIAHPGMAERLSASRVRQLFSGTEVIYEQGVAVQGVFGPDEASRGAFLSEVLGQSESALRSNWKRLTFRDSNAALPQYLSSDAKVVKAVASREGALGVVSAGAATPGVIVVHID